MKIEYYLPETVLSNEDLIKVYPEWTAEKILSKTGIASRHVAAENETALALYRKAGFTEFGRNPRGLRKKDGQLQTLVYMRLEL